MGNTFTPTSGYITPICSITDIENGQIYNIHGGTGLRPPPDRSLSLLLIRPEDKPGFGASVYIVASTRRPVRVNYNYAGIDEWGLSAR